MKWNQSMAGTFDHIADGEQTLRETLIQIIVTE